jgi:LacI family transcriptional regulator
MQPGFNHDGRAPVRPGMREVAERAGVAMSSVSRVLSDHPDVSPRMRALVMTAVEQLGYQPDMIAQGLRRGRTFSVGFALSDIANPVLAQLVTGAEKRLRESGYSLLLTNSEGSPDLDAEHILLLERRRVDGLILSLAEEHHDKTVEALRTVQSPVVLLDRDVPDGIDARSVVFDHSSGMRIATEHLVKLGHRDVALIIGGPDRPARERRQAVETTLARAGVGATCVVYDGEFSVDRGRRATLEIITRQPRPTAIITGGNMLMQGALLAFRDAGIEVGRDISFVGCDDIALAELHQPQIAVVRRDIAPAGAAAAELLLAELEPKGDDDVPPRQIVLPTEFVVRPSCAPVPARQG